MLTAWLASQRVPKEARGANLGHKPPRPEGLYSVYEYLPEKLGTLERWWRHLDPLATEREAERGEETPA